MTSNDILNKMTRVQPNQNIFITVKNTTINFSKMAFELLGKPEGIEIYCGDGKVAIKAGRILCSQKQSLNSRTFTGFAEAK